MENKNDKPKLDTKKLVVIIAIIVAILLVFGLSWLLLSNILGGVGSNPTEPTDDTTVATDPTVTEPTEVSVGVPVKVWDMETLPENLVDAGVAYANSNENIYGNVLLSGEQGKGLNGSKALSYLFVGKPSNGDIFAMTPNSIKDENLVSDWSQGEMLWFWVNGTELFSNVRLELLINGRYMKIGTPYYTVDKTGACVEVGPIPEGWDNTETRGRIRFTQGYEGWVGIPLEAWDNPTKLSSFSILVGNSTVKPGNVLYLDEFWLTKMGEVPPLPLDELMYSAAGNAEFPAQLWDVEHADLTNGMSIGTLGGDNTRNKVQSLIVSGRGVLGSKALGYRLSGVGKTNSDNLTIGIENLRSYGYDGAVINSETNMLWFWVDSDLSSDQLLHIQVNGSKFLAQKGIYTIKNNSGKPEIASVPWYGKSSSVPYKGVGVVYLNGTEGNYARIKIGKGWSGWLGIPLGNFNITSAGEPTDAPGGKVISILMRLYGAQNTMSVGDAMYFDEFWLTEEGQMPGLSDEALVYGYTYPAYMQDQRLVWNVEHSSLTNGKLLGITGSDTSRNQVKAAIAAGRGVSGSKALAYQVLETSKTNSENIVLTPKALKGNGFEDAPIGSGTDVLWFWMDADISSEQLLHVQLNGTKFLDKKSILTIVDNEGKPEIAEVPYYTAASLVPRMSLGVVPAANTSGNYARIKIAKGWSGWIGIPVGNFCITSAGVATDIPSGEITGITIRLYGAANALSVGDSVYLDEFWITVKGAMPKLSDDALLYGYTAPAGEVEAKDQALIWNLESDKLTDGADVGSVGSDSSRYDIKSFVANGQGVGGSKALGYTTLDPSKSNGQNVNLKNSDLEDMGFNTVRIGGQTDILWFWIHSDLSAEQLLHLQLNGAFQSIEKSIYTIGSEDGKPVIREVPYFANGVITGGVGVVPAANTSGNYARIKIAKGWSGWVGVPVENFCVTSAGEPADLPEGYVTSIIFRLYGAVNALAMNDTLYFDEFWLTKSGLMPDLTDAELLYGYEEPTPPEPVSEQRLIWNVEHESLEDGMQVGPVDGTSNRNTVDSKVAANRGIAGSNALAYILTKVNNTNSGNVTMTPGTFERYGFNAAEITSEDDIFWFWVDSDLSAEQLIHLQLNGVFQSLEKSIYTIGEEDGKAVMVEVPYYADSKQVPANGIGVVPAANTSGSYARIKISAGWSGWIGVPVKNFCVTSAGAAMAIPSGSITNITFRLYGAAKSLTVGDTLYFDEFWLTSADLMPDLSDEDLLYGRQSDVTDDQQGTVVIDFETAGWTSAKLPIASYPGQSGRDTSWGFMDRAGATLRVVDARSEGIEGTGIHGNVLKWTLDTTWSSSNTGVFAYLSTSKQTNPETDWSGYSDMMVWIDTSKAQNSVEVELRLLEADANGTGQLWVRNASGTITVTEYYYQDSAGDWVPAGAFQGRAILPAGYKGYLRVAMTELVPTASGVLAGSDDTMQKTEVLYYGISARGTEGDVIYIDSLSVLDDAEWSRDTQFRFSALYRDHMIFQQNKPWLVKGFGAAGQTVTVELRKGDALVASNTAAAAADGMWSVTMDAVAGSFDAYTVTATCGETKKSIQDVVFGEVWITGGQSNMQLRIQEISWQSLYEKWKTAPNGNIRIYIQQPDCDYETAWIEPNGVWSTGADWTTIYATTGVGYYFAERLQAELGVPVGIVNSAVGGTGISTWVDPEVAAQYPEFNQLATDLGGYNDKDTSAILNYVGCWFNTRVAPFQGYQAAGMLWYQGEHDRSHPQMQTLGIEVLVESWSKVFDSSGTATGTELAFVGMQVAPYATSASDSALTINYQINAAMREGVEKVVAKGGKAISVPTYDFTVTVNDIHPTNKAEVGLRSADAALGMVYGKLDPYSGPVLQSVENAGGKLILTFTNVGTGLQYIPLNRTDNNRLSTDADLILDYDHIYADKLNGFMIWSGGSMIPVDAQIVGTNQIEIVIPEGVTPLGVNYAYGVEVLAANLYNRAGYPSLPFFYVFDNVSVIHQTPLWNLENVAPGTKLGTLTENDTYVQVDVVASANQGVKDSQALAYILRENVGKNGIEDVVLNQRQLLEYGFDCKATVSSMEDILWFWVDSDISADIRLQIELNNTIRMTNGGYIYIIVDKDGEPEMVQIDYQETAANLDGDVGLTRYIPGGLAEFSRIKLCNGWSGWIGVPISNFKYGDRAMKIGDVITNLKIQVYQNGGSKGEDKGTQEIGDTLYLDEFWLTSAGQMPNLSKEELLYVGDEYVPATHRTPLWNLEAVAPGTKLGTITANTSYNTVSVTTQEGFGVTGSKALAYTLTGEKKLNTNNSEIVTIKDLDQYGFDTGTTISSMDDILWFWVDSKLSSDHRLALSVNGIRMHHEDYIYTIQADASGKPQMVKVMYQTSGADVEGLGFVHYAPGASGAANDISRIKICSGWSGWIGVPATHFVQGSKNLNVGDNITSLTLQLYQNKNGEDLGDQVAGDTLYFDEFWLTSADLMPDLTDVELLYGSEGPAGEQKLIWNVEHESLEDGMQVGPVDGNSSRNTVDSKVAANRGIAGSNALAYILTKVNNTNSGNVIMTPGTFEQYGLNAVEITSEDDIFWFWVDSDLSAEQMIHLQLNGVFLSTEKSIYTIGEEDGKAVMAEVPYYADSKQVPADGIGVVPVGSYARIKLAKDWSGWIGVPVKNFCVTSTGAAMAIPSGGITNIAFRLYGTANSLKVGDTLYFDEFWLTSANTMPCLTDEELLYTAPEFDPNVVALWTFGTETEALDLLGTGYVTANPATPAYSTLFRTNGKGYGGKNALRYQATDTQNTLDWWYVNLANQPGTLGTVNTKSFESLLDESNPENMIVWIWVDATELTYNVRMNMGFDGIDSKTYYTYTECYVLGESGTVEKKTLTANGAGNGLAAAGTRGRVPVEAGFKGWIGIPVSNFQNGSARLTAITQLRISLNRGIDEDNKAVSPIQAGDALYIGDVCVAKMVDGQWATPRNPA